MSRKLSAKTSRAVILAKFVRRNFFENSKNRKSDKTPAKNGKNLNENSEKPKKTVLSLDKNKNPHGANCWKSKGAKSSRKFLLIIFSASELSSYQNSRFKRKNQTRAKMPARITKKNALFALKIFFLFSKTHSFPLTCQQFKHKKLTF